MYNGKNLLWKKGRVRGSLYCKEIIGTWDVENHCVKSLTENDTNGMRPTVLLLEASLRMKSYAPLYILEPECQKKRTQSN